jgi:serine O-acetyltransferase
VTLSQNARDGFDRFLDDAARWVRPQQVAGRDELSARKVVGLLVRYPSLRAMAWYRLATFALESNIRVVPSWIQRRMLRLYALEMVPGCKIAGGLYIAHPAGCVLVAEWIGHNVTVIGQVTFGTRTDDRWPRIGDDVFVGAGARILGGIDIGPHVQVGANAVVTRSVEAGQTVVGVPARPLDHRDAGR